MGKSRLNNIILRIVCKKVVNTNLKLREVVERDHERRDLRRVVAQRARRQVRHAARLPAAHAHHEPAAEARQQLRVPVQLGSEHHQAIQLLTCFFLSYFYPT